MPIPNQMARVRNHTSLRENYVQEVTSQISSAFINNSYGGLDRAYPALVQIERACGPCTSKSNTTKSNTTPTINSCGLKK